MKIKKHVFAIVSVLLIYSFLFMHAKSPKIDDLAQVQKLFNTVKPMALDLIKTNDALDILDDQEIEKLIQNISTFAKITIPIIKQLPQNKEEPPTPATKSPEQKAKIKPERAKLLKAIGFIYLCAGTLDLNKEKVTNIIEKLTVEQTEDLRKSIENVMESLSSIQL